MAPSICNLINSLSLGAPEEQTHVSGLFSFTENEFFDDNCFHFTHCVFLQDFGKYLAGDQVWNVALNFDDEVIWIQKDEEYFDPECMEEFKMPDAMKTSFEQMVELYN